MKSKSNQLQRKVERLKLKRLHRFIFLVSFIDMVIEGIETPQYSMAKRTFIIVFLNDVFRLDMFVNITAFTGITTLNTLPLSTSNVHHSGPYLRIHI